MYDTYYHQDYSAGLNDTASPIDIAPSEASVLRNWDITHIGKLIRRDGLIQVGNTISANPITGLGSYIRDSGKDILCTESTNLYYLNGTTWTKLQNTLTSEKLWFENVQALSKVFMSSENNLLQSWDRSSATLNTCITQQATGNPHGNVIRWHKNHMFTLNNANVSGTKYPNRIYWSALGDPTIWDNVNNYTEVPGNGRVITAVDLGDNLVIFKERSIQYLSGWGDNSWKITGSTSNYANVDEQVGCIAPRGACRVGNEIWFVDELGQIRRLYQTDFDPLRKDIISKKIQTTLSGLNRTQISQALAWSWNNKVYFAFPNGTDTHNSILCVFDLIAAQRITQSPYFPQEAWTTYTGLTPNVFEDYLTNTTPDLYIGDATTGKVYIHSGNDDNGVAIDAVWEGKDDGYGHVDRYKRYAYGYITAQSGQSGVLVGLYASVDSTGYANINTLDLTGKGSRLGPTGSFRLGPTGKAMLGGSTKNQTKYYFTAGGGNPSGETLRMSIRHKVVGQKPTVNTFTVNYKLRDLR